MAKTIGSKVLHNHYRLTQLNNKVTEIFALCLWILILEIWCKYDLIYISCRYLNFKIQGLLTFLNLQFFKSHFGMIILQFRHARLSNESVFFALNNNVRRLILRRFLLIPRIILLLAHSDRVSLLRRVYLVTVNFTLGRQLDVPSANDDRRQLLPPQQRITFLMHTTHCLQLILPRWTVRSRGRGSLKTRGGVDAAVVQNHDATRIWRRLRGNGQQCASLSFGGRRRSCQLVRYWTDERLQQCRFRRRMQRKRCLQHHRSRPHRKRMSAQQVGLPDR